MVRRVATELTFADRLGHWQMRWGIGRMRYRIAPGLYAVGQPAADSPVLVTANYKLTVDLLRQELTGLNAWMLVLDTKGINVWCAAGKGTFGTAELLRQVAATRLAEVVNHRTLIVPQLGAPGVSAHEVRSGCGFRVIYGPVRATDVPAFLAAGMQATPAMRRVTFSTGERLVLTPVELTSMLKAIGWGAVILLFDRWHRSTNIFNRGGPASRWQRHRCRADRRGHRSGPRPAPAPRGCRGGCLP